MSKEVNEVLIPVADVLWDGFKESYAWYKQKDPNLQFNDNKKVEFQRQFIDLYCSIKEQYMKSSVSELDRHKVAAASIIACIKTDIIYREGALPAKKKFLGQEMIATEVALKWMLNGLNSQLKSQNVQIEISDYTMPTAFACPTPYFEIFSRNLYFARKDYKLNPLDIAEKLFLLEYITLLENNIDPTTLKFEQG